MDKSGKDHIDWEIENTIVEIKSGLAAIRDLRDNILKLAYQAIEHDPENVCLVLLDSRVMLKSIIEEWERALGVLNNSLRNRMLLVVSENGQITWNSRGIQPEILKKLESLSIKELKMPIETLPKPDFNAEVLKILINVWIVNQEILSNRIYEDGLTFAVYGALPKQRLLTITKLEEMAGCAYRTVDKALTAIGTAIERNGNKGFGLKFFPRYAWEHLVVLSGRSRSTMKFTDRSGRPRSPDSLLTRLAKQKRADIAIGGVTGANRIYPDLDITTSPRLDLTMHCPDGFADMSFIRYLDPALRPWQKDDPPPSLAIHFLRRKPSFFRIDKAGVLWADPIECLLDLLEARLDHQALQFREALFPEGVS